MRDFFNGINRSANVNSRSFEDRNILDSNNEKLLRYSGLSALSSNRQGAVAQQTVTFGAIDPRLTGRARELAIEDRMNQVKQITGNNPNVKMTPEAWNMLAKGSAVNVNIQLNAPDRRNLSITAAVGLNQLIGAIGGAAYNKEQGQLLIGRAKEDANFVTKYGNNYTKGFMGIGAQYQDGIITVDPVEVTEIQQKRQQIEAQTQSKKADTDMVVKNNPAAKPQQTSFSEKQNKDNSQISTVQTATEYDGTLGVQNQRNQNISNDGNSIENNAYKSLGLEYLKQLKPQDLKGTGLKYSELQGIIGKLEKGKRLDDNEINKLRNIGFSVGQDNGGNQTVVTSIMTRGTDTKTAKGASFLDDNNVNGKLARLATADYLKVAVGAGVITNREVAEKFGLKITAQTTQKEIDDFANKALSDVANDPSKGKKLGELLQTVENRIANNTFADGTKITTDPQKANNLKNFKADGLIGGQHITELQFAANERIKQSTDAAKQVNDVINGVAGAEISETTAAIYNDANGLKGDKRLTAAQLKEKLASGDLSGVNNFLNKVESNIGTVRGVLVGDNAVAGGFYGKRNTILGNTLRSTDGADNDTNDPIRTTKRDFTSDVKDLRDLVAFRQSGGTGDVTNKDGVTTENQTIAQQANILKTDIATGTVSADSQTTASNNLAKAFNNQLKANGITGYTDAQVSRVLQANAGTIKESDLDPKEKTLLSTLRLAEAASKNPTAPILGTLALLPNVKSIGENFTALTDLEKAKKAPSSAPQSQGGSVTLKIGTESESTGTVTEQANKVSSFLKGGGTISDNTGQALKDGFSDNLRAQLIDKGIGDFSKDEIELLAKAVASGNTDAIKGNSNLMAAFTKINADQALQGDFKSVGNMIKEIDNEKAQGDNLPLTNDPKGSIVTVAGKTTDVKGNVKESAETIATALGESTLKNGQQVKDVFTGELSSQLQTAGIKKSDGTNFSQATIEKVAQAIASGKTNDLSGEEKALFDSLEKNPTLKAEFEATGKLFNKIDNNQQSKLIASGASNIAGNVAAVNNAGNQFTSVYSDPKFLTSTDAISKNLSNNGIKNSTGQDFTSEQIKNVASAIENNSTSGLKGFEKELFDKLNGNTKLLDQFKSLGNNIDLANRISKNTSTQNQQNYDKNINNSIISISNDLGHNNISSDSETIQDVAKAIASGKTSELEGNSKELYEKIKSNGNLVSSFNILGNSINNPNSGVNSLLYLDPYRDDKTMRNASGKVKYTMNEMINGVNKDMADRANLGQENNPSQVKTSIGIKGKEQYLDSDKINPETLQGKTSTQNQFIKFRDLLSDATFFAEDSNEQDNLNKAFRDGNSEAMQNIRKTTFTDKLVSSFIAIADQILSKIKKDNPFSYGWADNARVITSNYNGGNNQPLSEMYSLAKQAGQGAVSGMKQVDKYQMRRNAEDETKGENISIDEGMKMFREKNPPKPETTDEDAANQIGNTTNVTNNINVTNNDNINNDEDVNNVHVIPNGNTTTK